MNHFCNPEANALSLPLIEEQRPDKPEREIINNKD